LGMINQLQRHVVMTLWAQQRVFAEAVEEALLKRLGRQHPVASRINGTVRWDDLSQLFSDLLITHIAMESVISDSLKSFGQNVLNHPSNESQDREIGDRFPLAGWINPSRGHEDMQVGVVMAGSSGGLENNDVSDIEFDSASGLENVFETGMSCSNEWTEQCEVTMKPCSQKFGHGQYHMAIGDARQKRRSIVLRHIGSSGIGLNHMEFLELILQDELLVRNERQIQRRVKAATFREQRTLEDFDWQFNPSVKKNQIYDLATGQFIEKGLDVCWLGPPGTGKSHLCQAIGYQAIKAGFTVRYRSVFDVPRDFLHEQAFEGADKVLAQYLKPDLLIIDDMGMKQLPKRSGEYLFEIIMRRYETKSTMMTSNRPLEDWGKLLGDVPSATAILDRFLHHAEIITITGKSYRLKDRAAPIRTGKNQSKKDEDHQDNTCGKQGK